jgi:hypothetical protein
MTLRVRTADTTYNFDGPFKSANDLKKKSGVYVISTIEASGKHQVIDVGESGDVQERVTKHDRADTWPLHVIDGLFISAYYCDEKERMKVERQVRDYCKPPCGDR